VLLSHEHRWSFYPFNRLPVKEAKYKHNVILLATGVIYILATHATWSLLTNEQACVQPRPSAVNTALPAFHAESRAAAPYYRSLVACDWAVSKLLLRQCWDRQTDGRTTVPLHRPCCAYYAGSANKTALLCVDELTLLVYTVMCRCSSSSNNCVSAATT